MCLAGLTNAPSISAFVAIGLTILAIARILTTKNYYHLSIWIDDVYRCQILFSFLVCTVPLIIGVVLDYIFLKDSGSSGGRAGAGFYSSIVCILILVLFGSCTIWKLYFCESPKAVLESED